MNRRRFTASLVVTPFLLAGVKNAAADNHGTPEAEDMGDAFHGSRNR